MEEACCCDCDGYKVKINGAETWYEALTEHNFGFVSQPNRLSDQHMRPTLIHSKNIISNRSKILLFLRFFKFIFRIKIGGSLIIAMVLSVVTVFFYILEYSM